MIMNWKELKDFCDKLPENELEKKVILWREDEVIGDISAITLEEDHYVDPEQTENGCFSESEAIGIIKHNKEDFPGGMDYFKKVYSKGHPILCENF
jgi:hypothetical protein